VAVTLGSAQAGVGLKQIAEGFTSPVAFLPLEDSGKFLVADQVGTVHVLLEDGKVEEKLFLDLRSRLCKLNQGFDERGLIGLALHPKFKENGRLFVVYSAPLRDKSLGLAKWDHTMVLAEFKTLANNRAEVDSASERILLQIDKPWFNHNGGFILFGPDGNLYMSVGDGGNANGTGRGHSPIGNGQDLSTLLGKILRINVDKGDPYSIPGDNPMADAERGRPEIYAWGLRNAWRMSFDRGGKRELFAADVGQTMYEELNIIVKGGNYGWNVREGLHCFDPKNPNKTPEDCAKTAADGKPFIDPIAEYKNINGFRKDPEALGISVTGGYVYRGKAMASLAGKYIFADWSRTWALPDGVMLVATPPTSPEGKGWTVEKLELAAPADGKLGAYVVGLGEDKEGELYVLTNGSNGLVGNKGKVFKLVPM
jgi:glucose/arabinose dehydrogenase